MADAGIFGDDEHVELLDGVLVEMSPQGPPHAGTIGDLAERLRRVYPQCCVREQCPLVAGQYSLPEPDLALVPGSARTYVTRHPNASEALLVVEIASSSRPRDRRKSTIYARAGAPVYWLIDLTTRKLEVRAAAEDGVYTETLIHGEDDRVSLPDGQGEWSVSDLLPPA